MAHGDKMVTRMTRDGVVEDNLTEGTSERVSKRLEDAQLIAPHDAEPGDIAEEVRRRRQLRPDELENAEGQTKAEMQSTDTVPEYKPGELPVSENAASYSPHPEAHHTPRIDYGKAFADNAFTGKVSRPRAERQIDGNAVLERATETSAEMPDFGEETLSSGRIERLERKSQKAHERLDAAREKLPTKKVLKKERVFDEKTGKGKTRLHFEDELKVPKGQSKLQFEADKTVRKVGDTLASGIHGKIHEVEQENSGVEAAHKTEITGETVLHHYQHHKEHSANKPFEKVSKLEQRAEATDRKLHFEKTVAANPEIKSSRANMNKHYQKQQIKKEYAAARRAGSQTTSSAVKSTGKSVKEKVTDKVKEFFSKNKKVFLWFGAGLMILVLLAAGISSCTAMFSSSGSSIIASSYLSEDDAMTGAEAAYCDMEAELQDYLDNYESTHDYDEYHYDLDEIEHDPYVLISILSALHEGVFTLDEAQVKEWASAISVPPDDRTGFIVDKVNPGLLNLFAFEFMNHREAAEKTAPTVTENRDPEVVAWEKDEITSIEVKVVDVAAPVLEKTDVPSAPKHRLTTEEKQIKDAVMDKLKAQIAQNNDGMLATYRASDHSFKVMLQNGIRIEGNTVTQNGEPLFAIHRRYSTKKTQGCYRELTPTLEYINRDKEQAAKQEKPSIREQLKAAKAQTERKTPAKSKSRDMGLE